METWGGCGGDVRRGGGERWAQRVDVCSLINAHNKHVFCREKTDSSLLVVK